MSGHELPGRANILVVDDEPAMRTALQAHFVRHGWKVTTASGVQEAMRAVEQHAFELVITDVRMRDGNGLDLLGFLRQNTPATPVILLTAFGSVPEAVESMRVGAFDYLTKPLSFEQLEAAAVRVMRKANTAITRDENAVAAASTPIVGRSAALRKSLHRASIAASTDSDVLVEAESGTGKELLARYIHETSSRKGKPFVAINCAAVPEDLLESELFGHSKGAFTGASSAKPGKFEVANGGTLLLDEIGEMPLALQPKLLRVLQERELERVGETRSIPVDIRVIATTNASLAELVERGLFRGDLYYRLNVIPLSLPPLREREGDLDVLALHFAEKFARAAGRPVPTITPEFLQRLRGHRWPGNVRELANFMRRVLSLHPHGCIGAEEFDEEFRPLQLVQKRPSAPTAGTPIAVLERTHLENTLALTNGNRTRAAEMLGISVRTMRNKIREYGLPPRRYA
jgi:DNA-binding NtrC family response regulator